MDTINRAYYMGQRKRTLITIILLVAVAVLLLAVLRGEFITPDSMFMAAGMSY